MEDVLVYVLCEDVAQDLARYGVKYGVVDVYFVHLKTYFISECETESCKPKEGTDSNETQ